MSRKRVEVTITVKIGDRAKTFQADGTTTGDPTQAADGLLIAMKSDAQDWIYDVREARS